ncbi:Atypical kinase COQ8A, mitochondrial [Hondaea fermentalgiana]|uniref:Atypical kinase COQ8A, mitochondrial n=1 Tax=Hondaea fermentalgiana TaxID=2315210 RepID=A0A2R5GKJ6_9STRA|nr:Atypical kinase COQ8A, mitochondrial [Hondaea fermentalgiana]|eukprot:GBG29143.1 Atypical kinase COQ8A, mitochondrial [Hondaea fermentalgiana]
MDLFAQDLLGGDPEEMDKIHSAVAEETLSSAEALQRAARALEKLVDDRPDVAKDIMCGVVVLALVKDTPSKLLVDLKAGSPGPGGAMRPSAKANEECSDDGTKADIRVIFEAEEQFRGVMSRRLEFAKLMQLGQIKIEGALRAKMKLMGLADVGKRLEREAQARRNEAAMASISWENEPLRGNYRGNLEKKSEWLKNWNQRYFTLEWDPFNRPTLSYAPRQGDPPRSVVELHSSCSVEARVTSRRDKLGQAAFALIDRRSGEDILVLCAPSDKARAIWLRNIKAAITARARARTQAATTASIAGDSLPPTPRRLDTSSLGGSFREPRNAKAATPGLGGPEATTIADHRLDTNSSLSPKLEAELAAQLVAAGVESHSTFILRKIGWRLVPLLVGAGIALNALATMEEGNRFDPAGPSPTSSVPWTSTRFLQSTLASAFSWVSSLPAWQTLSNWSQGFNSGSLPPWVWSTMSFPFRRWPGAALVLASGFAARFACTSPVFTLARRRFTVLSLAARLIVDLKITELKTRDMPPVHADATWRVKHRAVAEQVYAGALSLGGLWVKLAQHMGARADAMPEGIVNVLSRLQDAVPPTPFAKLKPHLERELGQRIEDVFEDFQETPIAAASIGQVHTGRLRSNGAHVVIKVQHPGVDRLLRQDVQNMGLIATWISVVDSKFSGLVREVVDHWRKNVLNELDFLNETENMRCVGANLASCDDVYASVPTAIDELCTRRVITMRFVRGSKVTDFERLAEVGVIGLSARTALADDLCNAFAHQIFIGGLANADPHPGNILVAKREDVANGEIMRLPACAPSQDTKRAVPVILDFGLALHIPDNVRLGLARLVLAASQLDAGGIFEGSDRLGIRLTRENLLNDFGDVQHLLRDTAPPEESRREMVERIEIGKRKWEEQNFEIPIESFPPELVLMVRSLNLLRALCSSLEVRQPFVRTLASWARRALLERYPAPERPLLATGLKHMVGKGHLATLIQDAIRGCKDHVTGIQVAVLGPGTEERVLVAAGQLSHVDCRPVSMSTLFPSKALAQSLAQMCAHNVFARRGATVSEEETALLSGDLSQVSFDPTAVPGDFETKNVGDWASQLQFVRSNVGADADAPSLGAELPYELSHLAFSWGWAVMALLQEDDSDAGEECVLAKEARRLGGDGLRVGLESVKEAESLLETGALAQSSFPVERLLEQHGIRDVGSMGAAETLQAGDANPLSMVSETVPTLKGKEFWADPRIANLPRLAAACLPAMNALCTAEALAQTLHSLAVSEKLDSMGSLEGKAVDRIRTLAMSSSKSDPFAAGHVGLRQFKFSGKDGHSQTTAIGQIAFGGNAMLTFPDHSLTVCVLVNELSMDATPTQACFNAIYQYLGLSPEGDF